MDTDLLYLVDLNNVQLSEDETSTSVWIHALPLGDYIHPVYGKIQMTADRIKSYAESVKNKVRGIDPSINWMHGDGGDGEAAGWVKDAEARQDGLWLFVDFVKDAAQAIKDKKWRYFSAEYNDSWTDPVGKEHKNVLFGGALTNRPYMKNLLPINLSEKTVSLAFELVDAITKAKKVQQEEDVDLKKLNELLGLPEGTSEGEALAKLTEVTAKKVDAPKKPSVPSVDLSTELKKLAEENPMVKTLIDTVDAQNKALRDYNISLREAEISRRLAEFDNSKIMLTARAKDLVHDLLTDMPDQLTESFWELLELMRKSTSFMVEVGERAGANVKYGRARDAKALFLSEATRLAGEKNISLTDAMAVVAGEQPDLYNGYRQESFAFRE